MKTNSNSEFKEGCLRSNLGPKNTGSLLFVYKRFLVIFFVLQKENFITVKKNSKKVFFTKKNFTERKFEICCEAKKILN